jgi:hypothetical protein
MDLSEADVQRRAAADRREVDPPIQVETATWRRVVSGKADGTRKPSGATLSLDCLVESGRLSHRRAHPVTDEAQKRGRMVTSFPLGWPRLNSNWPTYGEPD